MTTNIQPQPPNRFGLPDKPIQAIQQVLAAHLEVEQAIVYGSPALARQRPASDIDLSRLADLSHPPLLDHIARLGQLLYSREDQSD